MDTERLFLAVSLPDAQRDALVALQRAAFGESPRGVRPVRREQLHLTLRFLGDTPSDRVPAVRAALEELAGTPAPRLALDGVGRFPPRGAARVLWAGLRADGPALDTLVARLNDALAARGFAPPDQPFRAHVTLARVRERRRAAAAEEACFAHGDALTSEPFVASPVTLFASELAPGGATHRVVAQQTLD